MPNRSLLTRSLLLLQLFICIDKQAVSQNYIFAQLTGSPMNTAGWNLQGSAQVTNVVGTGYSELLLCPNVLNSSGAAFYNQPINLSQCNQWTAEFDFRMFDGDGADGLTFCFLDVPPVGFVLGGGLGIPATANGLKVCFDTWNNCIPFDPNFVHSQMPKIEIRWGIGYGGDPTNAANGECNGQPTRDNSDGKISYIRSPNYNHAKITYDTGNISVFVNDTLYLTAYQTFNFTGYLGFTASTGGYDDNHSIKNVVIYTKMPPSFAGGGTASICPGDTVRLGGPSNPSYTYTWSPSNGLSAITSSAPMLRLSNDSSIDQFYKYYVRTAYSDKPGCASIDSISVKVYPNPKVNFILPQICLTDAVGQFTDSSYTGDSTTLPFTYRWDFGDPFSGPGNLDSSNSQNPSHHYSAAQNYAMRLTVKNSVGCVDSATKIFTVNGAVPKADFNILDAAGLCSNSSVQIVNNSSVDFGSIIRLKLMWGDSASVFYTDSTPFPGKTYAHLFPNPVTAAPATYTVHMLSYSGISCVNEMDKQVVLLPSPHTQFNPVPYVCVYDSPFQITQASELSGLNGNYSFFGRGVGSQGLFDPGKAGPGTDSLLYVFAGADGCRDSASQSILVIAPPKVSAGSDTAVVVNQPLQLQAVVSDTGPDTFSWSPVEGLSDPGISNPVATLGSAVDSIWYVVKVTDTAGCYGEDSILVKVFKTLPDIFVPNAFTPGNSMNNVFRPIPVGIASLQYFKVYNRWGQLVYSTTRMGEGWDGNIGGKPQGTGSYVWLVQGTTYTGHIITKKGTMTLIR